MNMNRKRYLLILVTLGIMMCIFGINPAISNAEDRSKSEHNRVAKASSTNLNYITIYDVVGVARMRIDIFCTYGGYIGYNRINLSGVRKDVVTESWSFNGLYNLFIDNFSNVFFMDDSGATIATVSLPVVNDVIYSPGLPISSIQTSGSVYLNTSKASFQGAYNVYAYEGDQRPGGYTKGKVYSQGNLTSFTSADLTNKPIHIPNDFIKWSDDYTRTLGPNAKEIIASYNLRKIFNINESLEDIKSRVTNFKMNPNAFSAEEIRNARSIAKRIIDETKAIIDEDINFKPLMASYAISLGYRDLKDYWNSDFCLDAYTRAVLLAK